MDILVIKSKSAWSQVTSPWLLSLNEACPSQYKSKVKSFNLISYNSLTRIQEICLIQFYVRVPADSLGQLLLCIGAQLQKSHEHRWHVHIGLPNGEASTN